MHLKLFSKKNEVTTLKDEDIQICKFRRCLQGIRENVDTLVKNMDGQERRKINNYKKKLLAAFAEMYRKQLLYEVATEDINRIKNFDMHKEVYPSLKNVCNDYSIEVMDISKLSILTTYRKPYSLIGGLRKEKGYTFAKLSELSGISTGRLSDLVSGKRNNPTMDTLIKLADALDVSLDGLVGRK